MKLTREIKTAVLVIASILLFIWGFSFLKGKDILGSTKKLYVEYDNVEGLVNSAPITISGKIIGKVSAITLNPNGKLLVELLINEEDFPISKSSVAQIYEPGFIGGKQIAIIPNYKDKNLAESGDKILADLKLSLTDNLGQKLQPTQKKIEGLVTDADQLMLSINNILDAQTRTNLKQAISELNQTLAEFNKLGKGANTLLANNQSSLNKSLGNIEQLTNNFSKISEDLEKAKLGETIKSLDVTLANVNKILSDMEAGKGTLGKVVKDEALYTNLSKASKELELLLQDVRLHPTRYVNVSVFGKKEKPYNAPAEESKNNQPIQQ